MAKFGHVFVAGVVWIAIYTAVGSLGFWMTTWHGHWFIIGWILAILGCGMAILSVQHVWFMTSNQINGMRMMRDDPENWARLQRRYEDAINRIDD